MKFLVHGVEFDDGVYQQDGAHRSGLWSGLAFPAGEVPNSIRGRAEIRANVQKLVEFTGKVEKNSGASARLLWSESDENFAQKLIARLQKVQ